MTPHTIAVVLAVDADADDSGRLRAMGVCVGRRVEIVQPGDPLVLRVLGSRLGLSARLARHVTVQPERCCREEEPPCGGPTCPRTHPTGQPCCEQEGA